MQRRWEKQFFLMKQLRRMGNFLILSLALNIALFFVSVYNSLSIKDQKRVYDFSPHGEFVVVSDELKNAIRPYLSSFSKMTYARLIEELGNNNKITDDFIIGDLSLSYLISYYDFDLDRALGMEGFLSKKLTFGHTSGEEELTVVLGLVGSQREHIASFLQTERWPFNSRGLFKRLKLGFYDERSLKEAFYNTPEFYTFFTLINRGSKKLSKADVLALLLEGHWDLLEEFYKGQKRAQDMSLDKRRQLLLDYIAIGSVKATDVLIETDSDFILRYFEDKHLRVVLRQMSLSEPSAHFFLRRLLQEENRKELWAKAERLLKQDKQESNGSIGPELARFQKGNKGKVYRVKKNDTLWGLSKKFNISAQYIKRHNHLYSDTIYEDQQLLIPR